MANHRRYTQLHEPIKNTKPIHAVNAKHGKPETKPSITTEAENEANQSEHRAAVDKRGKTCSREKAKKVFFSPTCYWLENVSNKNEFVRFSTANHREIT